MGQNRLRLPVFTGILEFHKDTKKMDKFDVLKDHNDYANRMSPIALAMAQASAQV